MLFFSYLCTTKKDSMVIGSAHRKKPWRIPKEVSRAFGVKKIDDLLDLFNRACGGSFYMVDYHSEKILIGNSSHSTFSGYSRALVEKEGFEFYHRILSPKELNWLTDMCKKASKVFYGFSEEHRRHIEFTYDLLATTANNKELILRYKLVPFQFDRNDNLWLGLIFCQQLQSRPIGPKAFIDDSATGDRYDYVDGEFVLSEIKTLTKLEISILKWLANGISGKNICGLLEISERNLRRKEQALFEKLNADTAAAAIYKATKQGII